VFWRLRGFNGEVYRNGNGHGNGSSVGRAKRNGQRGAASWAYIYIALGFLLSFEGTIIQLITPLRWPYDLIFYVPLFVLTSLVFLASGRFQGWLVRLKTMYEDRFR